MTEKLKRLISLLCLIAMLSVVSIPANAGGEHPWDSDAVTGEDDGTGTGSDGNSSDQGLTGVVYVGSGGLITFVGQSFYSFLDTQS
jgi:hypothetical protein